MDQVSPGCRIELGGVSADGVGATVMVMVGFAWMVPVAPAVAVSVGALVNDGSTVAVAATAGAVVADGSAGVVLIGAAVGCKVIVGITATSVADVVSPVGVTVGVLLGDIMASAVGVVLT